MATDASSAAVAKHVARRRIRPLNPLDKKIPENPKYKNVKPTIDTGASLTKYMNKIEEIKTNYKFRKDEIFKRMKISTFVQLVIQVHRLSQPEPDIDDSASMVSAAMMDERGDKSGEYGNTADVINEDDDVMSEWPGTERSADRPSAPSLILSDGDYGDRHSVTEPESTRSTLLSVTRGIGEMDIKGGGRKADEGGVGEQKPSVVGVTCPYLLLDVRDKDEYDQCHIIPALSYSKAYLSRTCNYESREMLQYKNREGRVIILYDDDEKIAPVAATTLVQRGYDNLFMLSGGLKVASKVFPEGLISGSLPFSITGQKPKQMQMASQTELFNEDVDKLEIYLDRVLQDSSACSSRASSKASSVASSRYSRPASMSSRSSVVSDRPPFKL